MDNQDQQYGGGGATQKGQMDGRRRKNEGITTSDESTAESSFDHGATTGYLNSKGIITEDGMVDLLKNLIGWPERGDIDGEGNRRQYLNSEGILTEDGTVDLLKCFVGSPPETAASNGRQGNHGGGTVGLTQSVRAPTEAAGVNDKRNDDGTVGLIKPLMGAPPETAGSSIGARNVDGRKVAPVKPLMGPPPETAGRNGRQGNHSGGTVGLTQSVRAPTEAAGVNGKPLVGPPPETAERSKGWVLALEHKSASTSWNLKEHQPHRALAANPENSAAAAAASKKRKQVIKNTVDEKKSKAP